jgi:hypothetical protein
MAKKKIELIGMEWDFSNLFNESLRCMPTKPMVRRDYLWASELQGDFYSRYLKMWCHPMSNPPNERSQRKFCMGHIIEWIVGVILTSCGILKNKQLHGEVQLPGLLKVTGRLDFVAGGNINWGEAAENLKRIETVFQTSADDAPPIIRHASKYVFEKMKMMFTHVPLREYILEVKSCAGMIMKLIQKSNQPRPRHTLQPLHYLIANPEISAAQLLYVSKDDAIMETFIITETKELRKIYVTDVKMMTEYYNGSTEKNYLKNAPPKEKELIFEEDSFTFQKNMNVQYSNFLSLGWGYEDYDAFEKRWAPVKASYNRVFKRHVLEGTETIGRTGKPSIMKLTSANLEVIKEAQKDFPLWDKWIAKAKAAGAFQKQEEETEED